jgi:hypothetical protein
MPVRPASGRPRRAKRVIGMALPPFVLRCSVSPWWSVGSVISVSDNPLYIVLSCPR